MTAYVGLGANLGDPQGQVRSALGELARIPRTRLLGASPLYMTAPVGGPAQPDYVNAVAAVRTGLSPRALLDALFAIESGFGRTRAAPNEARPLDLDLLLYGDRVIDEPGLQVPHPRMHLRRFTLEPLAQIDPGIVIPGHGTVLECLSRVAGQSARRIS